MNRTLDILGNLFEVTYVDLGEDAGDSNAAERVIRVDKNLPPASQAEVLYHEVIHMMLDMGGYSTFLDPKLEEALTQYLGVAVLQFLTHNNTLPVLEKNYE
jgi:hypothetical protein